jgi:hypothetical protein
VAEDETAHETTAHETAAPAHEAGAARTERTEGMTTTDTGSTELLGTDGAARRRGPDPLALLVGLATLAMAVFAFVGDLPDLSFDPRWLLAGGAAVVGLFLLVGSLRGRPRGPRN